MKLREYQAKGIFAERGIRTPRGEVVRTAQDAAAASTRLGGAVVLKPQLGVKGRGKVGGIGFADTAHEARGEAARLFASTIKGETVRTLLVEERIAIADELYVAVTVDTSLRAPVVIVSPDGGVDIETVAREKPDRVRRLPVDIIDGPSNDLLQAVADFMGEDVVPIVEMLYSVFRDCDAEIVEINPLVRAGDGNLVAVDAVLNVNEDSMARHPDLLALGSEIPVEDPIAEEAARAGWTYIELDGDVGILSSGAGLTMAILDLLHRAGSGAANFLDTAQIDDVGIIAAFELLSRSGRHRALLVNVFAGLNRCDLLAEGIRRSLEEHPLDVPVVVRMVGNREEEGHRILRDCGVRPFTGLEEAVETVARLAKEAAR